MIYTAQKYENPFKNKDYEQLNFTNSQSELLHFCAQKIVEKGGIDTEQDMSLRRQLNKELENSLTIEQRRILEHYKAGEIGGLLFLNLLNSNGNKFNEYIPEELPALKDLTATDAVQLIAARSSLLLELVAQKPFAYDIENYGKSIRLVGNFKKNNKPCSHSGVSLSAHTETPYFCSKEHIDGHSPAPSSLILSALWNPLNEPTNIIPMYKIIEEFDPNLIDELKKNQFDFIRSDSFNEGEGSGGQNIKILEDYSDGTFMLKFNLLRFKTSNTATPLAQKAIERLKQEIEASTPIKISLNSKNALIINNFKTMHCRDHILDNRRLLIRLFGYENNIAPIILSKNPYIVKG